MKSAFLVYPVPTYCFREMLEACVQLQDYYKQAPVSPLYVATMKRAFLFENAQGQYAEFDCGDHFLVFEGKPDGLTLNSLFSGSFPSDSLLRELRWEGHNVQVGVLAVDDVFEQSLATIGVSFAPYIPNDWVVLQEYARFAMNHGQTQKA